MNGATDRSRVIVRALGAFAEAAACSSWIFWMIECLQIYVFPCRTFPLAFCAITPQRVLSGLLTQQQLRTARSFQLCSGVLGLSAT